MSELPTTGRANADYKFRPNYYAQLNDKIARVGFTLGFDRFHVCSYTAINSPRGKKKLEPGIAGKRRCKQRQIVAQQSKVRA